MNHSELLRLVLADSTGTLKDQIINDFADQAETIWCAINRGVDQSEYENLTRQARTIESFVDAVETLTCPVVTH